MKTNSTLVTALFQLTPALGSRDPVARATAQRLLRDVADDAGVTPQEAEAALAQIQSEIPLPTRRAEAPGKPAAGKPPVATMETAGPKLWAEWHIRALAFTGDDTAYLMVLWSKLPCGECKGHFLQLIQQNPPRFGEAYFGYTVDLHNLVNKRLGKPTMTREEARAHWSKLENQVE